jgi:phosphoribosylglycinamide formyltransferase-1
VIIISNNPDSPIIQFAKEAGFAHEVVNLKVCGSEGAAQQRILERLAELNVDLIVLSGYMKKLGADLVARYAGRIFNIHPALLPKYGGKGMYGIHVHEAVIAAGETETGITIHQVDQNYDEGPIVARLRVPVCAGDTAEMLAERVKQQEPAFLVRTLREMQRREKT